MNRCKTRVDRAGEDRAGEDRPLEDQALSLDVILKPCGCGCSWPGGGRKVATTGHRGLQGNATAISLCSAVPTVVELLSAQPIAVFQALSIAKNNYGEPADNLAKQSRVGERA